MANTCENTLIIKGSKKEIDRFCKNVGHDFKNEFRMEKLLPISDEMCKSCSPDENVEEFYWGTMNDVFNVKVKEMTNKIVVEYSTNWTPNGEFIKSLSLKFPKLEFELLYAEGGCWLGGSYSVQNGEGIAFEPSLHQVYFAKDNKEDKYTFITDYEIARKNMQWDYVLIPGLDWRTIFSVKGYSSKNVSNWDYAVDVCKGYIDEVFG